MFEAVFGEIARPFVCFLGAFVLQFIIIMPIALFDEDFAEVIGSFRDKHFKKIMIWSTIALYFISFLINPFGAG